MKIFNSLIVLINIIGILINYTQSNINGILVNGFMAMIALNMNNNYK